MKKYRIITDNYNGFEVQETFYKYFWKQSKNERDNNVNSFSSIERAKEHIQWLKLKDKKYVVYQE